MNKLNVSDYVRSKNGTFYKITDLKPYYENEKLIEEKQIVYVNGKNSGYSYEQFETLIKKSSPNIIDLIEVGDYVNGLRVEKNKYGELYTSYVYYGGDIGKQCEVYTTWLKEYTEDMICEIVTKEQFENISYKVGE